MTALNTRKENRIRAFRQTKGWSMQTLADAVGTSKSQIDKLEKGERRLTVEWMVRIAKRLECDPRELLPPSMLPKEKPPTYDILMQLRALPREDGKYYRSPAMMEPPVHRPPFLNDSPHAYAMNAFSNALHPAYKENTVLFIDPDQIPTRNADIIVTFQNNSVILGEYVGKTETHLILHQTHPTETLTEHPLSTIDSIHPIVGSFLR